MILIHFLLTLALSTLPVSERQVHDSRVSENVITNLVELLDDLADQAEQPLLKLHFQSIISVIQDQTHQYEWAAQDSLWASESLEFFQNEGAQWETYTNGPRPLIMGFTSPSDGKTSFYWLFLPKNFNPEEEGYPFYMELHGSGGGKNDNPRNMLFRPLRPEIKGVTSQGYRQEGLFIYPWGRGDKWYQGQSMTDVLECMAHFDRLFNTDASRQYLYGFSMGGSGVLSLAQTTSERWTALGIYSGAFRGGVDWKQAAEIKNLPVWITWGEEERLAAGNKQLRDYLMEAGAEVKWQEVEAVGH